MEREIRLMEMPAYDKALFNECVKQLNNSREPNREALEYYEGKHQSDDVQISTPQRMRHLKTVTGWPGTIVDCIDERLDFEGWLADDDGFLNRVYAANHLDTEASQVHLDALIYGVSFAAVSPGGRNEPHPLVVGLSAKNTTGIWNPRTRLLSAALTVTKKSDETTAIEWLFWTPTHRWYCYRDSDGHIYAEGEPHGLGRVPVVAFPNRPRTSREFGRSEITRAIRYYTDAAQRTLLGMEINREFYNTPQRVGLNMPEDAFDGPDGVQPWTSVMGQVWMLPPDPNGGKDSHPPQMQQFPPSSPKPYVDQVREYQALVAAEAGVPEAYLGLNTENPSSADAIRALESRLVKRVERRQATFGRGWLEVAALCEAITGREADPMVTVEWGDPSTPTRAATADAVSKLVGAGILPPNSDVTLNMLGISAQEREQLRADRAREIEAQQLTAMMEMPALPTWPGTDDGS